MYKMRSAYFDRFIFTIIIREANRGKINNILNMALSFPFLHLSTNFPKGHPDKKPPM